MNAYAWALGRALQFAAATAIVALAASTFVSDADAERFATTAYLATIVAALVLILRWFVRGALPLERERGPLFPAILSFVLCVALFVIAGVTFAFRPETAVQAAAASFGLIGAAALVRGGAIGRLRAKLSQGDRLSAATRYSVAVAVAALGAGALLGSPQSGAGAKLAYLAAVVAAAAVTLSLIAPTRAGALAQRRYARAAQLSATPASALVFAQTAEYGIATAIAAMLLASVLPRPFSERFATAAYLAVLFAALGVAMRWRLRNAGIGRGDAAVRTIDAPARFATRVVAFALLGAMLAFSYIAEATAIVVSLYFIGAAIAKRARMTTA